MKLSEKLIKKINNFASTYDGIKKATADVAEQIEEMRELTEEGAESKLSNFSQRTSVLTRKFSESVAGLKDKVDEVVIAADDVAKVAESEVTENAEMKGFARKARILKKSFASINEKYDIVNEAVGTALDAKLASANIKDSVANAPAPGIDPDADEGKTTAKVSVAPKSDGVDQNAEVEVLIVKDTEKVNFSVSEFVKFSIDNAVTAFNDFSKELEEMEDLVEELKDYGVEEEAKTEDEEVAPTQVEAQPQEESTVVSQEFDAEAIKNELIEKGIEAYNSGNKEYIKELADKAIELEEKAPGMGEEVIVTLENFAKENPKMKEENKETITTEETVACPKCGKTPCECTSENFSEETTATEEVATTTEEVTAPATEVEHDYTKDQEKLVEAAIKAFASGDKDKMQKVADFCEELNTIKPNAGTEVVETIENFATLFKLGFGSVNKFFGAEDKSKVLSKVKELVCFTTDKLAAGDKVDIADLAAKCEDLEKELPGVGEVIVSTVENFSNTMDALREKMTPDSEAKAINELGEAIERFVEDIPVADKSFSHKLKRACYAALESCDSKDKVGCVEFCARVGKELAEPTVVDQKLKDFGKSLNDFCGRFAKFDQAAQVEIPAEVSEGDKQLNEVLDKMGEKGAQLDAKTSTFATKLCDSYKSMKCFTEEQLENKIQLVESLKASFSEVGVNFSEEQEAPAATEEVKVENPAENAAPITVGGDEESAAEATEEAASATEEVTNEAAPAEETAKETEVEAPKHEVAPGEIDPALVNAKGDENYDPSTLGGLDKLVEEEVIPEESRPDDASVTIPINFSKTDSTKKEITYNDQLDTLFGL